MPTEITKPSASILESVPMPPETQRRINSPDGDSLGLTPLAIAAILALTLHLASGVMLDRSHASPAGKVLDEAIACVTEPGPPQPSLPYD